MATKQIGVVAPVPMGEWTSTQKYNVLNIVTYNSSTYIAKQPGTGIEPGVTAGWGDYWMLLFNVQTDDIATKAYVNSKVADYLPLAGGTMTGALAMGTNYNRITFGTTENCHSIYHNPQNNYLFITGVTEITGNLICVGGINTLNKKITNLATPTANADAANKQYVDTSSSSSATIDGTGLISYKNSAGTTLFTLQLPIYNGGVS